MTDLKTIPLQEFMAMPLNRKMVLMRHAFSKVENPILQFRCWREALAGWNVQRQDLSVELATLCEKHPDDRVWVAFQHLMILDSSTRFISQSDGTQRLALARWIGETGNFDELMKKEDFYPPDHDSEL